MIDICFGVQPLLIIEQPKTNYGWCLKKKTFLDTKVHIIRQVPFSRPPAVKNFSIWLTCCFLSDYLIQLQ